MGVLVGIGRELRIPRAGVPAATQRSSAIGEPAPAHQEHLVVGQVQTAGEL